MATVDLPADRFDAVAALYAITHVPRSEHARLFRRIAGWLVPGGAFVASLGSGSSPGWTGEWMGTEMFFSHYDADTNLALLREAGLVVERAEELEQDDEDGRFLWVVARKPAELAPQRRSCAALELGGGCGVTAEWASATRAGGLRRRAPGEGAQASLRTRRLFGRHEAGSTIRMFARIAAMT